MNSAVPGDRRRWARSVLSVGAVTELVELHYGLAASRVELVRVFTNDVYRIVNADRSYALKIYGSGRYTVDGVRWEQALTRHLVDAKVPVAADVPLRDGDSVGVLEAPEGDRPFALTQWLPGAKPEPPWTNELFRNVGAALARFHEAADTFTSPLARGAVRRDDEVAQMLAALRDDPYRQNLVRITSEAATRELAQVSGELQRGIRHGDPTLDNLHVDNYGVVYFFDLDLADPGWLAQDLSGATSTDFAEVFLTGYTSVRPLAPADLQALPWLRMMATLHNLYFHLVQKPAAQGNWTLAEGWVDDGFADLEHFAHAAGLVA